MHIVIVGAGYAGVACALRLARRTRGRARITLVNASPEFVERIRLHELAAGRPRSTPALAQLLRGTSIELVLGWARDIDLNAHTLRVGETSLHWDRLVLALGSHTAVDGLPGIREHAHTLDAASAAQFATRLPELAASRAQVVIVGGGLTGIEAATELAELHPTLRVALLTRAELAPGFSAKARAHVRATLERMNIALHEHLEVAALEPNALCGPAGRIPFDACLWTAGFRAPELAREAGLRVNTRGQVLVDNTLRALSHCDVYAAGDLAVLDAPAGDPMPMGCKSALPTGFYVADSIARSLHGERQHPFAYRTVPFCVSLGRHDGILEQAVDRRSFALRGKLAARVKELICRGTLWALAVERRRAVPLAILRAQTSALLPSSSARS